MTEYKHESNGVVIAADWLADNDASWWFFQALKRKAAHEFDVQLLGNLKWYKQSDRGSFTGHLKYLVKHIFFALRIWRGTRPGDILFAWNQLTALLLATGFRLAGSRRRVICQNFLYRPSASTFLDKVRRILYNFALGYPHISLSMQHSSLLGYYQQCGLKIKDAKAYFVPDCLPEKRIPEQSLVTPLDQEDGFVFTGGEANRDWELVFGLAYRLPHQRFCVVARKRFFNYVGAIPQNLTIYFDLPLNDFFEMMRRSRLVLIPIKDADNPAGLLLLFDAVALRKPVLASNTPYLRQFMEDGGDDAMFSNCDEAAEKMQRLLTSRLGLDERLYRSIREKASIENFTSIHLEKILSLK